MSKLSQHPDTEMLDRLRAGLLDEEPAQKAELEAHLQSCPQCRQRYNWNGCLKPDVFKFPQAEKRLHQARQQAMLSAPRTSLRRFVPLAAAAAIALVSVILVNPLHDQGPAENRVASITSGDVPEVYEELDFYLWLADYTEIRDSST